MKYMHENGRYAIFEKGERQVYDDKDCNFGPMNTDELESFGFKKERDVYEKCAFSLQNRMKELGLRKIQGGEIRKILKKHFTDYRIIDITDFTKEISISEYVRIKSFIEYLQNKGFIIKK